MEEPDVLVHEPRMPKHPRLLRVLVGALVVAVLLGASAVWMLGRSRAPGEAAALHRCVVRGEAAVQLAETKLGAMARYVAPVLGVVSADLDSRLYDLMQTRAADLDRPVAAALDRCRAVKLWPLSHERRTARAAFVAFLEVEVNRLRAISGDGQAYYEEYDQVRRLRQEWEHALART
jgi:hypothetical protein